MFGRKKYRVDYHGGKGGFPNAKDSYQAGEQVTLYYPNIATDTDYHFYVVGADYQTGYSDKGYEIRFVMPDHEVEVVVEQHNSMVYMPE